VRSFPTPYMEKGKEEETKGSRSSLVLGRVFKTTRADLISKRERCKEKENEANPFVRITLALWLSVHSSVYLLGGGSFDDKRLDVS
jgi:hypothetical protein